MNILILYGSLEGQTAKISERLAEAIRIKGHEVTTQSGEKLPAGFSVDKYDAAIIGGPVHMGKYPAYIKKFVTTHRNWLSSVPSAFFTVCMAVHSQHAKSREEAILYGENFLANTGWQPKLASTFAGAVKYTQYGFVTRFIMKMISKKEGGSTDTSLDHEYTDWESVERFAEEFVASVAE
jgi:menaquinone-dependent protoporphyrinogen oxidase